MCPSRIFELENKHINQNWCEHFAQQE